MLVIYGAIALCNCAYAALETTLSLWMEEELHHTSRTVGMDFLGLSFPLLALFPLSGWLGNRFGRAVLILIGLVLQGACSGTMPVTHGQGIPVVLALFGVGV